jgi:photosystem II stability/assembly factor-like uncharacterized protein
MAKSYIEGPYPPKGAKVVFERSFNGGLTWIEMNGIVTEVVEISRPPIPERVRIFRTDGISMFYFLDSQTGFMAVPSLIYGTPDTPDAFSAYCIGKTTDGGETWTLQIHWRFGNPLYTREIVFFDTQNGWIMSHGMLYHTTDGGNTWDFDLGEPGPGERGEFISIEPVSPNEYWLSHSTGVGNRLSHTTDGGKAWQTVIEIPSGGVFNDALFINPQEGWITLGGMAQVPSLGLGDFNGIIHTKDSGKNWEVDLKVPSHEVSVSLRNLTYDYLTKTLWASGGYSMIYKRMGIPTGIQPQGKFPLTWGWIKYIEKED